MPLIFCLLFNEPLYAIAELYVELLKLIDFACLVSMRLLNHLYVGLVHPPGEELLGAPQIDVVTKDLHRLFGPPVLVQVLAESVENPSGCSGRSHFFEVLCPLAVFVVLAALEHLSAVEMEGLLDEPLAFRLDEKVGSVLAVLQESDAGRPPLDSLA